MPRTLASRLRDGFVGGLDAGQQVKAMEIQRLVSPDVEELLKW